MGESRIIDFEELFKNWEVKKGDLEYPLVVSLKEFLQIQVIEGTFCWENIKYESTDEKGNKVIHYLDFDPIVMYEASELDF